MCSALAAKPKEEIRLSFVGQAFANPELPCSVPSPDIRVPSPDRAVTCFAPSLLPPGGYFSFVGVRSVFSECGVAWAKNAFIVFGWMNQSLMIMLKIRQRYLSGELFGSVFQLN